MAIERLYAIESGQGFTKDQSRWSPAMAFGPREMANHVYLLKHDSGWLLWDLGVSDAAAETTGVAYAPEPSPVWRNMKTLDSHLKQIGVAPAEIKTIGLSHSHPDHISNLNMFPNANLIMQQAEYEWDSPFGGDVRSHSDITKITGDHDLFGDGSAVMLSTPGHTPGHQSLLVRLKQTGTVILSGDIVHWAEDWARRPVPEFNTDAKQTIHSMDRIEEIIKREKAQLWVNHDTIHRGREMHAPGFYS
jgi:glyoxylase-like metal-dependent hydrolase (beta-lactamase superfamily II)